LTPSEYLTEAIESLVELFLYGMPNYSLISPYLVTTLQLLVFIWFLSLIKRLLW